MKVTREEARRIAGLAHLVFDDPGLDRIAAELTQILTYVDQLGEVDLGSQVSGIRSQEDRGLRDLRSETRDPRPETPLRDDVTHAPIDQDAVAANAPEWRDGFFVVPKVIGGGS